MATHATGTGAGGTDAAIHLEIVTPERRVVSEVVDEVILPGDQGSLGVLPGHTPLLVRLGIGQVTYRRGGGRRRLALAGGFAEVLADRVSVLAEIAERAEEIDRDRAQKARDRALARLRGGGGGEIDFVRAQAALQKALIRLQVSQGIGPNEPA
jgi:F-type H+-transporting ATPase subunit epsilon